jgi:hypothetical protein
MIVGLEICDLLRAKIRALSVTDSIWRCLLKIDDIEEEDDDDITAQQRKMLDDILLFWNSVKNMTKISIPTLIKK